MGVRRFGIVAAAAAALAVASPAGAGAQAPTPGSPAPGGLDGLVNSLQVKLAAATSGNMQRACGSLGAFVNEVNAQAGKKLPQSQANALLADAASVRAALGC